MNNIKFRSNILLIRQFSYFFGWFLSRSWSLIIFKVCYGQRIQILLVCFKFSSDSFNFEVLVEHFCVFIREIKLKLVLMINIYEEARNEMNTRKIIFLF